MRFDLVVKIAPFVAQGRKERRKRAEGTQTNVGRTDGTECGLGRIVSAGKLRTQGEEGASGVIGRIAQVSAPFSTGEV